MYKYSPPGAMRASMVPLLLRARPRAPRRVAGKQPAVGREGCWAGQPNTKGGTHRCESAKNINTSHTHTENNTPDTHTHDKNNTPHPPKNTPHKHLTTLEGGATTAERYHAASAQQPDRDGTTQRKHNIAGGCGKVTSRWARGVLGRPT